MPKTKRDWTKIKALILRWAQNDGTSDELHDVAVEMGFDGEDLDESGFWSELERCLERAVGAS